MTLRTLVFGLGLFAGVGASFAVAAAPLPIASPPAGSLAFTVSVPEDVTTDSQVVAIVKKAALARGWLQKEDHPNVHAFELKEHGVDATVTFVFRDAAIQAYSDAYKIRNGQRGDRVTPKRWLNNLREDITAALVHADPALIAAAAAGDTASLQDLIARHYPLNVRGAEGKTALILAAERGDRVECEALIRAGADITAVDWDGYSALTIALIRQDIDIADLLVDAGAAIPGIGNTAESRFFYGAYQKLVADRRAREGKTDEASNRYEVARAALSGSRVRFERDAVATVELGKQEAGRETKETEVKVATIVLVVAAAALAGRAATAHGGGHPWPSFSHGHTVGPIFHPHPAPVVVIVPVPIVHSSGSVSKSPSTPPSPPKVAVNRAPPPVPGEPVYVDPGHSGSDAVEAFYSDAAWMHSMALLCDELLGEMPNT